MTGLVRRYELYIGSIPELDAKLEESDATKSDRKVPGNDLTSTPQSGEFILLTNHHFEADIVFPKEGSGKKTVSQTFKVYNPAPDTERRIKAGNTIILKAGYNVDEFLPIICATQIKKSQISKDGIYRR